MQPTLFQRLFTDNRPFIFLMATGAAVCVACTGWLLLPTMAVSRWYLLGCTALLPVAACLGALLGAFPGGLLLGIVLRWVEQRCGAPFAKGDEVVILSKRFPGRVTRIYEIWAERHEVRVELGEQARTDFSDVFNFTDICLRRPRQKE